MRRGFPSTENFIKFYTRVSIKKIFFLFYQLFYCAVRYSHSFLGGNKYKIKQIQLFPKNIHLHEAHLRSFWLIYNKRTLHMAHIGVGERTGLIFKEGHTLVDELRIRGWCYPNFVIPKTRKDSLLLLIIRLRGPRMWNILFDGEKLCTLCLSVTIDVGCVLLSG